MSGDVNLFDDGQRRHALLQFRRNFKPLLDLADAYPDATDVFIDGGEIRLELGDRRLRYGFADFEGLTPGRVLSGLSNAAVYNSLQFGPENPAEPIQSVKMPPDVRVSAVIDPVSDKVHVVLRFLRARDVTLSEYVEAGIMTAAQARELRGLVDAKRNIIVSGRMGSGKTTLLRCLVRIVANEHGRRTCIVEDTPELVIDGPNVLAFQTTLKMHMGRLMEQVLRMSADAIVLGEVRSVEASELLMAMNFGITGVMCTLHSNGREDAIDRLWHLTRRNKQTRSGEPTDGAFLREEVEKAIDVVVQMGVEGGKRKLEEIWYSPRMAGRA